MKKLRFMKALLLMCLLMVGIGNARGEVKRVTLSQSNIYNNGIDASTGYQNVTLTDEDGNSWEAFAIKNYHSNATKTQNFLQIKKYASGTAYYIKVPVLGSKITNIELVVSNPNQIMTGGGNTATVYFSSSNSTSTVSQGVASGTGDGSVSIDVSGLNINTGYITASAAIRIWEIKVTYEDNSSTSPILSSIAVKTSPTKVSYTEGEFFDPTGLVITKVMSDASTEDVAYVGSESEFSFSPSLTTPLQISSTEVVITYGGKTTNQIVTVKEFILTTMDEIYAKAKDAGSTATDVKVKFNNWVITGVQTGGSRAYLSDGNKGVLIYRSGNGFEEGDVLNGTVSTKLLMYDGAAEFNSLTTETEGLTITKGGSVDPLDITTSKLDGSYTGVLLKYENMVYNSDAQTLSNETNTITPYTQLYDYGNTFVDGRKYNITGVYTLFYKENKNEILPRSANDIVEIPDVKYNISISNTIINGKVTSDKNSAREGEIVTLSVSPNSHYSCTSITVSGASGNVDVSDNKFRMPAEDVEVNAEFTEDAKVTINWNDRGNISSNENVYVGSVLQFPNAPIVEGWEFMGWTANNSINSNGEGVIFLNSESVAPEGGATYYAVFAQKEEIAQGQYTLDYEHEENLRNSTAWGYGNPLTYTANDGSVWVVKGYKSKGIQLNTGKDASIKVPDCPGNITTIEITSSQQAKFNFSLMDYQGTDIESIANSLGSNVTLDLSGNNVTTGYIWASNATSVTKIVVNFDGGGVYDNYTLLPTILYDIVLDTEIEHGTITASAQKAAENDVISLTAIPEEHYHLVGWNIYDSNEAVVEVTDNKFTMPASNVMVSASFDKDAEYTITWSVNGTDRGNTTAYEGDNISFTTPTGSFGGYTFMGWTNAHINGTLPNAPEILYAAGTTAEVIDNITYYAVFAREVNSGITEDKTITLDFVNDDWGIPVGSTNKITDTETEFTYNGYRIKAKGSSDGGVYIGTKDKKPVTLMLGKMGAYLTIPELNTPIKKITCLKSPNTSLSGDVKWNVYSGETAVSEELTGCTNGGVFEIQDGYWDSPLMIMVTSSKNTQFTGIEILTEVEGVSYTDYCTLLPTEWSDIAIAGTFPNSDWQNKPLYLNRQDYNKFVGTIDASKWEDNTDYEFKLYNVEDGVDKWWGTERDLNFKTSVYREFTEEIDNHNMTWIHNADYPSYYVVAEYLPNERDGYWHVTITGIPAGDYLPGNWNNWLPYGQDVKFENDILVRHLEANTDYEFKLYNSDHCAWHKEATSTEESSRNIVESTAGMEFTEEVKPINCKLTTTEAGDYMFFIDKDGETPYISVVYPSDLAVYKGSNARTIIKEAAWDAAQTEAPNAIALVSSTKKSWAESQTNVVVLNAERNYTCQNFVLTDKKPVYVPCPFVANTAEYRRSNSNQWGTICLPFAVSSGIGIQYYQLEAVTDTEMTFTKIDNVEANQPAVYSIGADGGDVSISFGNSDVAVTTENNRENNGITLVGVQSETVTLPVKSDNYYIANNKFWRPTTNAVNVAPQRAYFHVSENSPAKAGSYTIGISDEDVTAIDALLGNSSEVSVEGYYNVEGISQNGLQKGINIVKFSNGLYKKIVIK